MNAIAVETQRDFSDFSAEELGEMGRLLQAIARVLATRFSRRYRPAKHPGRRDLRRTLRASLRRGGELVDLAYRRRPRQKHQLVLLCDLSKSMDLYSRFLIQFIYAFQHAYRRIETFVFSTALHHITPTLRHGDIELLRDSMHQLQRQSRCLIWLNPLLGSADYKPATRGMAAALPHIDLFAPVHNLQSLKDLIGYLMALRGSTAVRRAPRRETAPGQTTAEPPPGKSRGLHRLKVRS